MNCELSVDTQCDRLSVLLGKYAPQDVKVLPLDLASGEESLKHVVEQAVSFFPGAGVDYLIHNAAYERPVSNFLAKVLYLLNSL